MPQEYTHLNLQSWELASQGRCGAPILAGDLSGGLECGEQVEVDTLNLTYP